MTKRYRVFKINNKYGVSDDIANYTLAWDISKRIMDGLCDKLNKQDQRIQELETKLNELAFEFLNHEMISMGKAVEISEMSYHDFLKYRKEKGNPMELQL